MSDKIILYDQPDLVSHGGHTVDGWKAPDGQIYEDEDLARWAACTHLKCDKCNSGAIHSKSYTCCDGCRDKFAAARFAKLDVKVWDEETPLWLFDGHDYFMAFDDLYEFCIEESVFPSSLRLVIADPVYLSEISFDEHFSDILPDEFDDFPAGVQELMDALNAEINQSKDVISWVPGEVAADVSQLDELWREDIECND